LADARKTVTAAATSGSLTQQAAAADALSSLLPRLSVIVESNPELKANTTVMQLMDELRDTADKVMYARRTLIDLTADYNVKIVTFPSNIVANMFGFKEEQGLKLEGMEGATTVTAAETKSPKVNL
jgi:LemA protein